MSNPAETYQQEAAELLEGLEDNLLELEAAPDNRNLVDTIFRALHSIKGSGEMFGFGTLAKFVHGFENAFDLVRSGKAEVTPELIDIALSSRDHISALLAAGQDEAAAQKLAKSDLHASLLKRIEALAGAPKTPEKVESTEPVEDGPKQYSIFFRPEASALRNGMRPELITQDLAMLGTVSSTMIADQVPGLKELDPEKSYLAWQIQVETDADRQRIDDIFLFFDDGDVIIDQVVQAEDAKDGTEESPNKPSVATDKSEASPDRNAQSTKVESVRVQSYRLDELMDQLGELVIAQARLNRIAERLGETGLASAAEEIERLVTGMRDATLSIRMLPIGGVFGKFRRVVRDLANELGKEVKLVIEGGETELDKNIIDSLSEPLVHILRNAVDHGIEPHEDRVSAGKPKEATLRMAARQTGGEVHISVSDDGGGLKTDRIRKRALERGLIEENSDLSEDAINQLIFAPGFSTAETVSNVSGRGVGMDAVRNFIEDLRGAVDVKSAPGEGTTITLRLPLTLAIIDGLLVRVGGGDFVIPLASVEECVELSDEEANHDRQRSIMTIRNELVPFLKLGQIFRFDSDETVTRVVIVNADGRRVGLMVDDVIGQHQTVIKSLSGYHRSVEGLAGCTILGDGSVALIIDPAALVKGHGNLLREAA
ncbi:MAG: chemotaxis protein CheA [Pseudomonadota bacterium]